MGRGDAGRDARPSDPLCRQVADALGGRPDRFRWTPTSGGTFTRTFRLSIDHREYFVKSATGPSADALAAEADGLRRLAEPGILETAECRALAEHDGETVLVLEWLDLRPLSGAAATLGERLAEHHREATDDRFGLDRDNWIGATPQCNRPTACWSEFLFEHRIGALLDRLRSSSSGFPADAGERLREAWQREFADYRPTPSLLHGDLWAGNAGRRDGSEPVVFDPAVHYGDRECDLAMAALFGGFGRAFSETYDATWPLEAGWLLRRSYYQLYHVLNHALLFGGGYVDDARRRIDRLLRGEP